MQINDNELPCYVKASSEDLIVELRPDDYRDNGASAVQKLNEARIVADCERILERRQLILEFDSLQPNSEPYEALLWLHKATSMANLTDAEELVDEERVLVKFVEAGFSPPEFFMIYKEQLPPVLGIEKESLTQFPEEDREAQSKFFQEVKSYFDRVRKSLQEAETLEAGVSAVMPVFIASYVGLSRLACNVFCERELLDELSLIRRK